MMTGSCIRTGRRWNQSSWMFCSDLLNEWIKRRQRDYTHVLHTPTSIVTDLAAGEPSNKCVDTAPPFGSHAGTCRMTEWDVWTAVHPVSPGTQQPLGPPAQTLLHQLHTTPNPGTMPHSVGRQSTSGELQHSQCRSEARNIWMLRMATHLRDDRTHRGRYAERRARNKGAESQIHCITMISFVIMESICISSPLTRCWILIYYL